MSTARITMFGSNSGGNIDEAAILAATVKVLNLRDMAREAGRIFMKSFFAPHQLITAAEPTAAAVGS